jgi:cob(I)alamin adenosyltransferase
MGLLIVFTGDGKGKTTAALGQVFRALGHGWKCCFVQFMKGEAATGEALFASREELLDFKILGLGFLLPGQDALPHRKAARAAWSEARRVIDSGEYRLVVLDELTCLCTFGFLDTEELLRVLAGRPAHVHVVVTGRGAPRELVAAADLVTEMTRIKHPLDAGIRAQAGIEY